MPFILGTAGHIDHGKTTLVQALTGINCDRLEEERKRGITIELGFAWMDLPDGQRLGIIDVPGHERFVKNMVAGAAGIDLVMLVIAADEGIMPQTREHLDICALLGIRQGFVVLTKCDMVDTDWLDLVRADVTEYLKDSFLAGCPVFSVSSTTGQGLDEVRDYIAHCVHGLVPEAKTDIFRLPVDRVFSLKGFGTIITGSVISGRVQAGQDAVIMPEGTPTHIRTLQRHEQPIEEALPGERCAANLQGLEVTDIRRGDVLAKPGTLFPSDRWIVRLQCLKNSPMAIRSRTEVHFHHGTLEALARVVFYDRQKLEAGETDLAEIRFDTPVAGVFGDHCVLRSSSPLRAVAGGMLISPVPPQIRARDPKREEKLSLLASLRDLETKKDSASEAALAAAQLKLRGSAGADFALLKVLTGLSKKKLDKALQYLAAQRAALCFDKESQAWIDEQEFAALSAACLARAEEVHAKDPLRAGFARAALTAGWGKDLPPKLIARVFDSLLGEGRLALSGDLIRLSGHSVVLDKRQQKVCDALVAAYQQSGLTPPNYKEVLADIRITEKEAAPILKVLIADGDLLRMRDGIFYSAQAFQQVLDKVAVWFKDHDDLTLADMKQILGLSRKYLIALLEYLDQERYTVRIGDKRQFRNR